jgi:1-acyl-sn-glycerol-3-phosphate acyltransferase
MNRRSPYTLRRKDWAVRACLPLLWLVARAQRLTVQGGEHLPRRGPALLLAKHRATRDSLLLSWALYKTTGRRANYLMKYGAAGVPPRLLEALGGVPVIRAKDVLRQGDRQARRAHLNKARAFQQQTMAYVAWLYAQDELVVIYPEGMFYPDRLGPLNVGGVRQLYDLAHSTGRRIPVLPIGLRYSPRALINVGPPHDPLAYAALPPLVAALRTDIARLSGLSEK